LGSAGTGVSS